MSYNQGNRFGKRDFGGRDSGARSFGGRDSGGRDSGGRSFGRRDSGGRDSGGRDSGGRGFCNRSGGNTMMHKAKCDECGCDCEVPFRPTGNKPVLCSPCFRGAGNSSPSRSGGRRDSDRPRFEDKPAHSSGCNHVDCKKQFAQLNEKLDMALEALVTIIRNQEKPVAKEAAPKKAVEINELEISQPVIEERPKKTRKAATAKKTATKKAAPKKTVKKKAATKKTTAKKKA